MKDNGIEDILIDNNYDSKKKKNKKGIIIAFFLLLIILGGLCFAYWYFTRPTTTAKQLFFNQLSNTNVKNVLEINSYKEILSKLIDESSEITSKINFSTTIENENLEGLDVSKFVLDLSNMNDVETKKNYSELDINYSGNEVLKVKMLANKDAFAIASDEIVNKYVSFRYNTINEENSKANLINEIYRAQGIDIKEEQKQTFINKYFNKIYENIAEEKFSYQDNYVLDGSTSTDVVAYTLKLNHEELKNLLKNLLTELKNDDELLEQLIEEPKNSLQTEENNNQENLNNEENMENDTISESNDGENQNSEENISETNEQNNEEFETTERISLDPVSSENIENEEDLAIEILKILFGKKANITLDDFKNTIDELINKIDNLEGNGIIFNIYASELGTEKINIILPNESSFDIELKNKSDSGAYLKVTYLYKGDNNIFAFLKENSKNVYSQEDPLIVEETEQIDSSKNSGYSIEINRSNQEASNRVKLTFSFINSEEINKKISLETNLEGNENSKNLKLDNIMIFTTENGETTITSESNIKFKNIEDIENINQENTLFLEDLSQEEYDITVQAIKDKISQVYNEKKEKFNFLDANIGNSVIEQNLEESSSEDNKNIVKEALQKRIDELRNEAIANGVEFNLQSLENLQIDGYEVASTINENMAVVVIDIYTFNIDKDFNITEAQ
ncbi:MAG TPA: hypothetical protein IAD08_03555 [Candidatus Scatovivens faecipullorum]|nr:hypothetical protein [Candidatus Scatovivens faecipullorum]